MLQRIHGIYREEVAELFQLTKRATGPLSLLVITFHRREKIDSEFLFSEDFQEGGCCKLKGLRKRIITPAEYSLPRPPHYERAYCELSPRNGQIFFFLVRLKWKTS